VYAAVFKIRVIRIFDMSRVNNIISMDARRRENEEQRQTALDASQRLAAISRTNLSEIRATLQHAVEELAKTLEK
jgi:hypothetical protein